MSDAPDPRGKLQGTTAQLLREHPRAEMAIAMLVGPTRDVQAMQVSVRALPGPRQANFVAGALRQLAEAIERSGGRGAPVTVEPE